MIDNYSDIINLPHHTSKNHSKMPMQNRAAQFLPFQALTGYEEAIKETERITNEKKILADDTKEEINNILNHLELNTKTYQITYFQQDKNKKGGNYIIIKDRIKKIDAVYGYLITKNNKKILIEDIIDII